MNNSTLVDEFDGNSRSKVLELFDWRWNGKGYLMSLRNDVFVSAYVLDPYYTPAEFSNIMLEVAWISFITFILK